MKIVKYISIIIASLLCISCIVIGCFKFYTICKDSSKSTTDKITYEPEITYKTECVDAIVTDVGLLNIGMHLEHIGIGIFQ